ncbi:holin [Bifidobacterium sp. ESL0728]|uniref:holin n=1 Tax=Bifidobacterium sp. ESL0728 TaxID=2983220 RepID=UPI0023F95069|nr:holin [Bifidobacterium sp. ESL0728]WEV59659.1 holin [Bifidobacterium sp. ESL0728]
MAEEEPRHALPKRDDMRQGLERKTDDRTDYTSATKPDGSKPAWQWLKAAGIRAIKTAAQSALAAIPTTAATIGSVNWTIVAGTAALAAVISIITSIAGIPEVDGGTSLPQLNK